MKRVVQELLDWSEVWALLIPLVVLVLRKPAEKWVKPLKFYLITALLINLAADIIWKRYLLYLNGWMTSHLSYFYSANGDFDNTILYNIHSAIRFTLFIIFFSYLGRTFKKLNWVLPAVYGISFMILFLFYRDIRDFNSLLLAEETALLLIYCLTYYLLIIRDEESTVKKSPAFWAVTGISIYVVINFPIFLFYNALAKQARNFAIDIWDVHNISYLVFCLLIAKSFYVARR